MHCTTTTTTTTITKDKEGSPPTKTQIKDNITTYIHTYKKERKKSNHSFQAFKNTYFEEEEEEEEEEISDMLLSLS
jgi:ribosomal protein S1